MLHWLRSLFIASALVVAGCAPSPRPAAVADSTPAPAPVSELVKRVDIPYDQFTLPNGLRVIVSTDRKAQVVAVSVWYHVGSRYEPMGKTGFAHLFEHLMFNGSENADGEYFVPLENVGATDFNGTTWFDRTNYFQTVPTGALELALFLESDRMGHLLGAVTQEKLDNQRGVVQNEKRQGDNQPYGLVEYAQLAALFPEDHPYHHSTIGSMADLDAASLADVREWFRAHYGPNNAVLVLAGDIDAAAARPLVEKYFGDIPCGPESAAPEAPLPTLAEDVSQTMKDRVATTRLYRNWVIPGRNDGETVLLDVAAGVLGGLASSRLDNALVRQEKSAVSVTASVQAFEKVSLFEITADVRPGVDPKIVSDRLDAILANFLKTGPSTDEVLRVATRETAGKIAGLENVGGFGGKAGTLAEGLLYAGDPDHYKHELAVYAAATPETVRAAARKWLSRPVYRLTVEPGERAEADITTGGGGAIRPRYYQDPAVKRPAHVVKKAAVDRTKWPEVQPIADLDFPEIERATLANGIEVIFSRRTTVPIVRFAVSFDAGNAADPKEKLGTQALMLSLLDEGTTSRDSIELAEAQERLGATISTGATMDRTNVSLFALKPNLAASLDLLADVIKHPAFDPGEVERLRAALLAQIASEKTQPTGIALRELPPLLYGALHPYGVPFTGSGTEAGVAAVTRDDLFAFHRTWLRPDNAKIFAVGDTSLAELMPLLESRFGNWAAPDTAKGEKLFRSDKMARPPRIMLLDRKQSSQSMIIAGQLLPLRGVDDPLALITANEVLGGSFTSRLNMDLREAKGWSYGVGSQVRLVRETVPFLVYAPVQADRTGDSIKALIAGTRSFLTKQGITREERDRTINNQVRSLPGSFEGSGDVLAALMRIEDFDRPDDYYDRLADRYRSMTPEMLDQAARSALDPTRLIWVVVGDAAKVRPQLEGLGLPVEVRTAE